MKRLRAQTMMVLAVAAALMLAACSNEPPAPVQAVRPVVTMTIQDTAQGRVRAFSGVAQSAIASDLSFRVDGEIIELPAKVGLEVAEGELIARLDPTDYRINMREAEAQLAQATANYTQLKADYERMQQLIASNSISRAEFDQAEAAYRSSSAQVSAARERLDQARQKLKYTELLAPVAGTIAEVPLDLHQTVAAGTPVVRLSSLGEMEFSTGLPERHIGLMQNGQEAIIRFESLPGREYHARTVEVGVASGTLSVYPVTLRLTDNDGRVLDGMVGEASFIFPNQGERVLVPPQAVASDADGGRYVWVVGGDEGARQAHRRDVSVGQLAPDGLEITDGLAPGDVVVVRGVHRLTEGRQVRLMDDQG